MDATPSKRRVLGALDVNIKSPAARHPLTSKRDALKPHSLVATSRVSSLSPSPSRGTATKRPLDAEERHSRGGTPPKKPCLHPATATITTTEGGSPSRDRAARAALPPPPPAAAATVEQTPSQERESEPEPAPEPAEPERQRSASPAESSSLFDSSAHDVMEETVITEPDAEAAAATAATVLARLPPLPAAAAPPPAQRPAMTREEARQKAEILRLRLGLASYKVRTGQTDVPLERLQVRPPLSGPASRRRHLGGTTASSQPTSQPSQRESGLPQQRTLPPPPAMPPRSRLLPPPSSSLPLPLPPLSRARPLPPSQEDEEQDDDDDQEDEEEPSLPPMRRQTSAPPPQRKSLPSAPLQPRGASFSHGHPNRDNDAAALLPVAAKGLLSLSRT